MKDGLLYYRWNNCVHRFNMPIKVYLAGKETWLYPSIVWQRMDVKGNKTEVTVDPDFYIATLNITK
jgi:hypothetical protein